MEKDKALLESHGIAYQLQVRLLKLPTTADEGKKNSQEKFIPQLTPIINCNILNGAPQTKKVINRQLPKICGQKCDNELLISNGITKHISIPIMRQEVAGLLTKYVFKNARKSNCKTHVKKLYKCPICPSHVELSSGFLLNHLATNHRSKNVLKCPFSECEFSSWVPHFLKTHLARVHQQLPFHCLVCQRKFSSHSALQVHVLRHAPAESKKFVCPRLNCKFSTNYSANLSAHSISHDLELKYKCEHCGWRTKYKNNVAKHVRRIHGNTIKAKPFKCPQDQCDFTTESLGNLKSHSRFHLDHKPFKCQICKFSTKYKSNLKTHFRVHSDLKPFECNLCGKKMRALNALQDHVRRHLGEKPFQCPVSECGFLTTASSAIKMHVYHCHSKEQGIQLRYFKCPLCEKVFITKHGLAAHARTHTLEKPFSCSFCFRGFRENSSRKSHERCCKKRPDGLQIKLFKCVFCEKQFCFPGAKSFHEMTCKSRPDGRKI